MNSTLPEGTWHASYDFDVCVVGHITRDIVRVGQTTRMSPGGTAYYTATALRRLGLNVAVVTKGARNDREFLVRELREDTVAVFWKEAKATSAFENTYGEDDLGTRVQTIKAMGTPFSAKDVEGISASAVHLGPLVNMDMPLQVLKQAATKAKIVSLDVQGLVRPACLGRVTQQGWPDKETWLECVHILKADETEAFILSGEKDVKRAAAALAALGAREVIITLASRGSLVYANSILYNIPAWPSTKVVDPTGCGDTYMAGYLYERLRGTSAEMAGRFGAAMATLKLQARGPFKGTKADVDQLISSSPK